MLRSSQVFALIMKKYKFGLGDGCRRGGTAPPSALRDPLPAGGVLANSQQALLLFLQKECFLCKKVA